MKRSVIIGFLALIAFDTLGQIGFKLTAVQVGALELRLDWLVNLLSTPSLAMIIVAYLGAFVLYMTLMKEMDVGPLFAATHLELVSVSAFSYIWLDERMSLVQLCGCACIVAGVVMLGLSEHRSARDTTS